MHTKFGTKSLIINDNKSFTVIQIYVQEFYTQKMLKDSWLVWFNGLNASLRTKELLVQFLVGVHCLGCRSGPQ